MIALVTVAVPIGLAGWGLRMAWLKFRRMKTVEPAGS